MIQITLQFNTIDEAIVFLSKQHPVAKVRNAAAIEPIAGASTANQAGAGVSAGGADVRGAEGQQTPQTAPAANKRKPRADAGKPRGRRGAQQNAGASAPAPDPVTETTGNSQTAATASGQAAEQAANPVATSADAPKGEQSSSATNAPAPQTAAPTTQEEVTDKGSASTSDAAAPTEKPPSAPEASEKDAQDAIQKVFTQQGGPQLALDTLASFGVKRCRDLKPEQRGLFVARCNEILAGKGKS